MVPDALSGGPHFAAYCERYLRDPASVPEEWALFFAGFEFAGARPAEKLYLRDQELLYCYDVRAQ